MTRYQHDCDGCVFVGEHKEFDVYLCGSEVRSVIFRYGNKCSEYKSSRLFECAELTSIDMFCLMNGLELTAIEEKRLFETLCQMFRYKLTIEDYKKHNSNLVLGKGNIMFRESF